MPNIATQMVDGERIVFTKVVEDERRVSCSCCATDCCMYAASAFNSGQITIDDLPDTILAGGVEPLNKNDPPISDPLPDGTPFLVYYGLSGEGVGILNSNSQWTNRQDFGTGISNECLVLDEQFAWYTDNFEDTYTVATYETFQITRTGLCTWFGLDSNGCETFLEYSTDFPYKWVLSWSNAFDPGQELCAAARVAGPKEGFQNSPVGTYTDPLAFVSATIS
jgi:hypothetical protein